MYVTESPFRDLNDVTLADEGINSKQTDDVNRTIQVYVATQVVLLVGKIYN